MANLIENVDPKRNPITSYLGGVFILISAFMYLIKYVVPAFFVLKTEIVYDWHTPLWPLGVGVVLVFLNDSYFARIFNRADKIVGKKSDTE